MDDSASERGDKVPPAHDDLSAKALCVWVEFSQETRTKDPLPPGVDPAEDAEVDDVLDEFGGDFRAAIRALLHDLGVLAGDFASAAMAVSRGYVRGGMTEVGRRIAGGKWPGSGV